MGLSCYEPRTTSLWQRHLDEGARIFALLSSSWRGSPELGHEVLCVSAHGRPARDLTQSDLSVSPGS